MTLRLAVDGSEVARVVLDGDLGLVELHDGAVPIATKHTTYAIWIQTRSLIEAWRNAPELHGEELEPRPAGMPRPAPAPDPDAFEAGAAAMREAIATAKYDALQAGRLDLTAFEIRNVPAPAPPGAAPISGGLEDEPEEMPVPRKRLRFPGPRAKVTP